MLFVGDLPQSGLGSEELRAVFEPFGTVTEVRLMAGQCYGFVAFSRQAEAQEALLAARAGVLRIEGRAVRVDWAQGELPGWKRTGSGGGGGGGGGRRSRPRSVGGAGADGGAIDAPAAAQLVVLRGDGGGGGRGVAAAAVALVPLATAGGGGLGGLGPKPLLAYDDL
ncbi:hypothetical protein Rsub_09972 [Raphidocelis subcapitata]|uniref:RRM domain-containing protein n=1 Tax=Raphidocelis subcapitata TaxID=307507 RepID=A0A2V0PBP4_9CHLO|nr:hypothetical protein Rsub_09972 [Raphidocelis subcapitata]|eukprot:GBF97281.1 hypothetical protein Rsub_09972 [Raphidocelis subcapitata]